MKKLPPYGKRLIISPQTPIIILYVGSPNCWQAAKRDQTLGQHYHLALPRIQDVSLYRWPVNDCEIDVIDFGNSDSREIESLIIHLAEAGAKTISVRQMNLEQMTVYDRENQETAA